MPLERLTLLVLPLCGEPVLVVPGLEAPRVADGRRPVRAAALVGRRGPGGPSWWTWCTGRASGSLRRVGPGLGHHGAGPAAPPARRPVGGGLDGHLAHPGGQGRRRAGRAACRRRGGRPGGRGAPAGGIPLVGRTEAAVSADLGSLLVAEGHSAVNFAIVGQRPQCRQPAPRAREPGDRPRRDRGVRLRRHPVARRRRRLLLGHHPHRGDRHAVTRGACLLRRPARRPAGRGGVGPGRCDRRLGGPGGPGRHRGRRLRPALRPPHRPRHRDRGARGPVPGGGERRRRSCPATPSRSSRASTCPAGSACGWRTSWSSGPTAGPSRSTPSTTSLVVVDH